MPTVTIGASSNTATSGGSGMTSVIAWTALGFAVIAVALGIFSIDRARRSAHPAVPGAEATPERSTATE